MAKSRLVWIIRLYWVVFIAYMGMFLYFQHTEPLAFVQVETTDPFLNVTVDHETYTVAAVNSVPPHPILDWAWVLWVFGIPALLTAAYLAWPNIKKFIENNK